MPVDLDRRADDCIRDPIQRRIRLHFLIHKTIIHRFPFAQRRYRRGAPPLCPSVPPPVFPAWPETHPPPLPIMSAWGWVIRLALSALFSAASSISFRSSATCRTVFP